MEAKFEKFEGGEVVLINQNNETIRVPLEKLSIAYQERLEKKD